MFSVFFSPCLVVVVRRRQPYSLLRLVWRKPSSSAKFAFLPDETLERYQQRKEYLEAAANRLFGRKDTTVYAVWQTKSDHDAIVMEAIEAASKEPVTDEEIKQTAESMRRELGL